jgi:hypothetical protein
MFLRMGTCEDKEDSLAEQIKKDIITTLKNKGIHISMLEIDMKSDNLNISVAIREK